jgi:small subunit ribosomal protein S6
MHEYELTLILPPDIIENSVEELKKKITTVISTSGGTLTSFNNIGKKKLYHKIKQFSKGNFYLIKYKAKGEIPAELMKGLNIDTNILRHMHIKVEETKTATNSEKI